MDDKLIFSSKWEIDKLTTLQPIEKAVGTGVTTIHTITNGGYPTFDIVAKYSDKWYRPGTNGQVAGTVQLIYTAYITGTSIQVNTNKAMTVRLYLFDDKLDY